MLDERYSLYYTNNRNSGNSFLNMIHRFDHGPQESADYLSYYGGSSLTGVLGQ
jgi:hypothetical protein